MPTLSQRSPIVPKGTTININDERLKAATAQFGAGQVNKALQNAQGMGYDVKNASTGATSSNWKPEVPRYNGPAEGTPENAAALANMKSSNIVPTVTDNSIATTTPTSTGTATGTAGTTSTNVQLSNGQYYDPRSGLPMSGPSSSTGASDANISLGLTDLSADMQTYLNDPANRGALDNFNLVGTQGRQAQEKFLKDAEASVVEYKKQKDFTIGQNKIQSDITKINQDQSIREGKDALDKTTYNSAILNIGGMSEQARSAGQNQIRDLAKKIDETVQMYGLQNDYTANLVAENARRIQQNLEDSMGKELSTALLNIDNGIKNGEIASPEQLQKVYEQNRAAILKKFPELSNFAVQQMSDLTNNFMNTQKELRNNQILFNQNKAKIVASPDGFYIDGNGNQVLGVDGQPVKAPAVQVSPPTLIEETGQIITYGLDEFGNLDPQVHDLQGFKQLPKAPVAPIKPNIIETTQGLYDADKKEWIKGPNGVTPTGPAPSYSQTTVYTPPTGFESRAAGQSFGITQKEDGSIEVGAAEGTLLGECGAFANDFFKGVEGYVPVVNSWESKKNLAKLPDGTYNKTPVAGGAFMYNPGGKYEAFGHIGVVEKVNADGSFVAYDSNYAGPGISDRRTIRPGDKEYIKIMNDGGFFSPKGKTVTTQVQSQEPGIGQDIDMRAITIGRVAFGKTMSDKERESVLNILKKYPNVPNNEIALLARGMYLNDPKDTDKAIDYVNVFNNMETPPSEYETQIATYLNKKDIEGLNRYVDNQIEIDLKKRVPADEFISNSSYITGKQNTDLLIGLIDRNQDKIGAFDGMKADLLKLVKDDPEYQQIKTLLSISVADVRRKFAGSAVTDSEMKALEDFIGGSTKMTAGNLKTYLQTIMDKTTRQYDNQRSIYGAPGRVAAETTIPQQSTSQTEYIDFSEI